MVTLHGKPKVGAVAALGTDRRFLVAACARGRVSGIREALGRTEALRYVAECRAEEEGGVCRWVYQRWHLRAGQPFGERPNGEPLHSFRCAAPLRALRELAAAGDRRVRRAKNPENRGIAGRAEGGARPYRSCAHAMAADPASRIAPTPSGR